MKTITKLLSLATVGLILPLSAEVTETTEKSTTANADGTTTTTETKTTTFNPEARTKVVKYFETYKSNPYGLPPAWATTVKVKEIPTAWRTTISPGVIITEKERPYLMAAPPELVKVLPTATGEVRYYMAGGNVVAVNKEYKIVDSIPIPSVKFEVER